jgi:Tol biopolymer transport system component/DNA-binding winged helix-turn-helix (wHTH) protein
VPSFKICDRVVDPSLNRVTAGDRTVQVEPKIMQVLVVLAERAGQVVTRDELMSRVWNGVFVTDDALHRAIRELRRLFDDDSERPRVIETIRKRGYRLIAPVTGRDGQEGRDRQEGPAAPAHPAPRTRPALAIALALGGVASLVAALVVLTAVTRRSTVNTEAHVRFMPLTSEPGNEVDPALSRSGRLAYVARADDGRAHIFTKASADASPLQVTRGELREYAPVWSPDEAQLAFVRRGSDECAIWIAAADGSGARELTPCTATNELKMSWSPDGRLLAAAAGATTIGSPSHIEVIEVSNGRRRAVTAPPPAHVGDWAPAFSPDGRDIAFVRSISGSITDIFVVPIGVASGATEEAPALAPPRRVTFDNADVLGVDWEPDGRHLVFSSDRAGGIGLWRVSIDGGEATMLAGGGAKLKHPSVARGSGDVAYEDWQYEINLLEQSTAVDAAARPRSISATSDRWNFHPQISPDGTRIAFQSTRSGQYELWVSDRDGTQARPLTRSAIYKSPARWSPDGRHLTFTTRVNAQSDIWILDVDSGAARTVVSDTTSAVAPSWSHDGRSVYFGSLRSAEWQIWNVDVDGGQLRQVTTDGGYAAIESADGQSLFVTRLDRLGLWRRPIAGGSETLVVDKVLAEQWPNWGLYDRGVFFVTSPDDGDPQLEVIEHGTVVPRALARLPEFAWSGITLSRDGSRVIFAHADRRAANIGSLAVAR